MSERVSLLIRASAVFATLVSRNIRNASVRVTIASAPAAATGATKFTDGEGAAIKEGEKPRAAESNGTSPVPAGRAPSEPSETGVDTTRVTPDARSDKPGNGVDESLQDHLKTSSMSEDVTFGFLLGCATGYSFRTIGKAVLFFVGTEVIILQYLARREWVSIHWRRIGRDVAPRFSRSAWDGLLDVLVYKMPFHAAFTVWKTLSPSASQNFWRMWDSSVQQVAHRVACDYGNASFRQGLLACATELDVNIEI